MVRGGGERMVRSEFLLMFFVVLLVVLFMFADQGHAVVGNLGRLRGSARQGPRNHRQESHY